MVYSAIKEFFEKRKKKTRILFDILKYFLNSKKERISSKELTKKFSRYKDVEKIIRHLKFLKLEDIRNQRGRIKETIYTINNYHDLLKECNEIGTLIINDSDKRLENAMKLQNWVLTILLVFIAFSQFTTGTIFGIGQQKLQEENLATLKLEYMPDLVMTKFNIESNFNKSLHISNIAFCLKNKGGLDSGDILLNLSGDNYFSKSILLVELKSRSSLCFNNSIYIINTSIDSELHATIVCLNCEKPYSWTV